MYRLLNCIVTLILISTTLAVGQTVEQPKNIATEAKKGYELFDAKSYRAALTQLEKAREMATIDDRSELVRIEYHIAICAGRLSERNAMHQFESFIERNPKSAYVNDIRFAMANLLYQQGDYNAARSEYLAVSKYELQTSQQDEFNFKMGHTFFVDDDFTNAKTSFQQVSQSGEYASHTTYYKAYIDYVSGNYSLAKSEFSKLVNHPSYEQIIPFYLLQIEFLERNYDYVLQNGDRLLELAKGEREAEIARIMGETWFDREDFGKTLSYMKRYQDRGGYMGRAENYLVGYSQYMYNDISDAIESLTRVVGADDKLTQNAAYHLGGCYLRIGDKSRAMHSFSMAAGTEYDDVIREDALFNYGKLQYELGGGVFNETINILNRYITEYPQSERINEARELLIAAYYNSRNYEAAYEAIKLIPNPDNNIRTAYQKIAYYRALEYYNAGEYDTALRLFDESLRNKFNPKYSALTQYWRGEILYKQEDYARAIPLFKEYISLSPPSEREHTMAYYNLGYSHFNQQQWGEARSWFDRFLSNHVDRDAYRADALNRRGDSRFALREFSQALGDYNAVISQGGEQQHYAQYQRAMIQGLSGSRAQKVESLRSIISAKEGDYVSEAMYELGRTYMVMERFSDAAAILKQFTNSYPNSNKNLAALSDLGLAYQNMNQNSTALRYYKELAEKAPNSAEARDAMLAAKSIYVEMNDVDGYFAFARGVGAETDLGVVERDSLTFAAAERVYMTSADRVKIINSLKDYLDKFPRGAYRPSALFYISEHYIGDRQYDNAIARLKELSEMHYNDFTVKGLEKLAPLCYEQHRYTIAAESYLKLAETAVNPETKMVGYSGYLKSVKMEGDGNEIIAAADRIVAAKGTSGAVIREAKFAKAEVLMQQGDKMTALPIYKELSSEVQTIEGAQATYYVIESLHESGSIEEAESMILNFAAQNTLHSYWLGKAFLTLGDIYIKKGDNFQARATLQSVIDGYSPADDGIIDGARERINKLGN